MLQFTTAIILQFTRGTILQFTCIIHDRSHDYNSDSPYVHLPFAGQRYKVNFVWKLPLSQRKNILPHYENELTEIVSMFNDASYRKLCGLLNCPGSSGYKMYQHSYTRGRWPSATTVSQNILFSQNENRKLLNDDRHVGVQVQVIFCMSPQRRCCFFFAFLVWKLVQ